VELRQIINLEILEHGHRKDKRTRSQSVDAKTILICANDLKVLVLNLIRLRLHFANRYVGVPTKYD
jgi:hypothetical protein